MSGLSLAVPFLLLASSAPVAAQPGAPDGPPQAQPVSFRPSVAIVVGIFAIMFSLTILLLMYAKFCHVAAAELFGQGPDLLPPPQLGGGRPSGVDKTVIESLPFFRFSSLRGSRGGLECSVCLSTFEDTEILRLLPRCKHAFHIDCVDRWLEAHSSCPLCRCKVDAEGVASFKYSTSSRFLTPSSWRDDNGDLELFVEREPREPGSSSRFSVSSSFSNIEKILKDKKKEPLIPEKSDDSTMQSLHNFKHRIIVADVMLKSRWSNVNSSDLMALNSEMLNVISSKRFSTLESNSQHAEIISENRPAIDEKIAKIREEMEKKRLLESKASQISGSHLVPIPSLHASSDSEPAAADSSVPSRSLISPGNRSMSEITNFSRFGDALRRSRVVRDQSNDTKDEKLRKIWLPIARRTVQWFVGRERRSQAQYADGTEIV